MSETPETDPIDAIFRSIKRTRDELKLQLHLAGAEARGEWEKLERRWAEIEKRAEPLSGAVRESAEAMGEQAGKVADAAHDVAARELKAGYEKLRKLFG